MEREILTEMGLTQSLGSCAARLRCNVGLGRRRGCTAGVSGAPDPEFQEATERAGDHDILLFELNFAQRIFIFGVQISDVSASNQGEAFDGRGEALGRFVMLINLGQNATSDCDVVELWRGLIDAHDTPANLRPCGLAGRVH